MILFKKIFIEKRNEDILISVINEVLKRNYIYDLE